MLSSNFDFEILVFLAYIFVIIFYSLFEFCCLSFIKHNINFEDIFKFLFNVSFLIIFGFSYFVCNFLWFTSSFVYFYFYLFFSFFLLIFLVIFFKTEKTLFLFRFFIFLHFNFLVILFSYNLLIIFVGLEILTYVLYIFLMLKKDYNSAVVLRNYFIVNVFISIFFLFSIFLFYRIFGTLDIIEIQKILNSIIFNDSFTLTLYYIVPFICIFIVFGIKLLVFPFQFWAFDVYTWTKNSSYAFLLTVPKIFYLFILLKLSYFFIAIFSIQIFKFFLIFCGFFSLLLGYSLALNTDNIKRLFLYTSTSSSGFYFILLAAFDNYSAQSLNILVIFFFVNLIYSLLLYLFILFLYKDFLIISDLRFLYKSSPFFAYLFAFLLFSYAGFPPFIAFFVKIFFIFMTIKIKNLFIVYLIFYVLAWSPFFYFRIIKTMFISENSINDLKIIGFFNKKSIAFLYSFLIFLQLIILFNIDFFFLILLNF